jgi:PKD repeat protein
VANIGQDNLPPMCDANGPYSGTVGVPVQFDGSGSSDQDGTIVSYAWDFGDGSTGSGVNPTHTYNAPGNFVVTLTVTDDDGATSTCTATATITPPNQPPSCDANGPYSGDVGTPIQFDGSGSSDSDGTIVSYAWDFGDGSTGTGVNPTHTYNTDGNFTVTLCVTDDDGAESCCEATVTVFPPSAVELSSFTAISGGGVVTLQWSTSFEEDNAGFNVERADHGSDAYTKIGEVLDEGDGDTPGSYSYVDRTVEPGHVYQYRLQAVDRFGGTQYVGVAVGSAMPERLVLSQNNPNPFNPSTSISFALPEGGKVALRIYDAQGHLVRTLVNEELPAGIHLKEWDGKDESGLSMGSGVYLYRLETTRAVLQNKMVLMK